MFSGLLLSEENKERFPGIKDANKVYRKNTVEG